MYCVVLGLCYSLEQKCLPNVHVLKEGLVPSLWHHCEVVEMGTSGRQLCQWGHALRGY
jgi:hypothetical protein